METRRQFALHERRERVAVARVQDLPQDLVRLRVVHHIADLLLQDRRHLEERRVEVLLEHHQRILQAHDVHKHILLVVTEFLQTLVPHARRRVQRLRVRRDLGAGELGEN